jgi:hypothetical protein
VASYSTNVKVMPPKDDGRDPEHEDHKIGELLQAHAQGSSSFPLCELIRTDSGKAPLPLLCFQSLQAALQSLQSRLDGHLVPGRGRFRRI